MNLNEVKIYLKQNNFVPSKKMGQNFLIDRNIALKITKAIPFSEFDMIVEIGPGLGAITQTLINVGKPIVAVELDKRLFSFLHKRFPNLNIINDDILKVDWDKQLVHCTNPIVVSNLPYSISSPVLTKFFNCIKTNVMVCMLQKEMVERLLAPPKTHQYNAFSVFVQTFADITHLIHVNKSCFYPIPDVDSIVIQVKKKVNPIDMQSYDAFLKQCFSSKRKTLCNNLSHSTMPKSELLYFLSCHNLSPLARAEELTIQDFQALFHVFVKDNK